MTLAVQLTGLQAAQAHLDTIGNNVANVSTVAFKSSTPNFGDLYGASLGGGSGVSPGQGVLTTGLSQLFTEGSISQTGNPLDVAINGNGFLQVQTSSGIAYSRDGALRLNANGFLANDTGALVLGYGPSTIGGASNASGTIGAIQINQSNLAAAPTSSLTMGLSLPAGDTAINTTTTPFSVTNPLSYNESTATSVFDSLGAAHTLTTFFTEAAGSGSPPHWQTHWQVSDSTGTAIASGSGATLTFNSSGALLSGSGTISVPTLPNGAAALSITQDFAGTTLSDLSFQVNSLNNDGTGGGQFAGVSISSNGDVVAQYSNGATKTMGTIALASFVNPQGLIAVSGNNWLASVGSGAPVVNPPGASGVGTLESGSLEGSNVDLSTQLVNLIVAQQAYQANVQGINIDQQDVAKLLQL